MFSRMDGSRLPVESNATVPLDRILREGVRDKPDVSALASWDGNRLHALLWHYHDDNLPGPDAEVVVTWTGVEPGSRPFLRSHHRIDQDQGNAYAAWL
jgi:xylan 1,4-beta-xylosidase